MEIINHEYYVSLEVAKLLKKVGFKWFINTAYRDGVLMRQGNLLCDNFNGKQYENAARHEFFSAPTLEIAQRWLREIKGIFICTTPEIKDYQATWNFYICDEQGLFYENEDCFLTYEEAQEIGIKKALEIILNKGK